MRPFRCWFRMHKFVPYYEAGEIGVMCRRCGKRFANVVL